MASWHGADLRGVLEDLRREAKRLEKEWPAEGFPPFFPGAHSNQELDDAQAKCGQEIPPPVRALLRSVRGISSDAWSGSNCQKSLFLIQSPHSESWSCPGDFEDPDPRWEGVRHFCFAQSVFGDSIVYCWNPPDRTPGSIILEDHEMSNLMPSAIDDLCTPTVFLADNLAEWLARWMACGYFEYALFHGGSWDVSSEVEKDVLEDHLRLNPRVEWVRPRLEWMDKQDAAPPGSEAALIPCNDCGKKLYLGTLLDFDAHFHRRGKYIYCRCPACRACMRFRGARNRVVVGDDSGWTSVFKPIGTYDCSGLRAKKRWKGYEIGLDGFRWTFRELEDTVKSRVSG